MADDVQGRLERLVLARERAAAEELWPFTLRITFSTRFLVPSCTVLNRSCARVSGGGGPATIGAWQHAYMRNLMPLAVIKVLLSQKYSDGCSPWPQ